VGKCIGTSATLQPTRQQEKELLAKYDGVGTSARPDQDSMSVGSVVQSVVISIRTVVTNTF